MLINCVVYRDGEKVGDIQVSEIKNHLAQPNSFVWVALRDAEKGELLAMQQEFDLPDLAIEDAQNGHQRPKLEEYGSTLFSVLHIVEQNPDSKTLSVGEMSIFVGSNFVLSVRNKASANFVDVRRRCEREPHLLRHGSGFVLYALMDAVVDRYFPIVEALETELEQLEERIFKRHNTSRDDIEALYDLKGKLMLLQHAAAPLLETVAKLYGGRVPQLCIGMSDYYRDVNDHLQRICKSIDSIRDMLSTAMQVNLSLIALSESEVNKKLAAYAALFAIPTMIAGVYGMNFEDIPGLKSAYSFPFTLLTMVTLDVLLFRYFKKSKWL